MTDRTAFQPEFRILTRSLDRRQVTIDGHRLTLSQTGRSLAVILGNRASKATGHHAEQGVDAGDAARQLRAAIIRRARELASEAGCREAQIFATHPRWGTWLVAMTGPSLGSGC